MCEDRPPGNFLTDCVVQAFKKKILGRLRCMQMIAILKYIIPASTSNLYKAVTSHTHTQWWKSKTDMHILTEDDKDYMTELS